MVNLGGNLDHLPFNRHLHDDAGVIDDVGGGGDEGREGNKVADAAYEFKFAGTVKVGFDRNHIYRRGLMVEVKYGLIEDYVGFIVEVIGLKKGYDVGDGLALSKEFADDGALDVRGCGWKFTQRFADVADVADGV